MNIIEIIMSALAALIALTVHEYCHGYVAYKLGDDTAKNLGRLSLNPLKHLDPYGAFCMIFFRIGWAKPVPINSRNFKNPKRDFALCAAAGPASNLILGFFTAFLMLLLNAIAREIGRFPSQFAVSLVENTILFLFIFCQINIGLGIFNLVPIPPFDGSRLLYVFLPPKAYFGIMKYERWIYLGTIGWLIFGKYVAAAVRMLPFVATNPILYWLAGVFSLSGMVNTVIGWVYTLILNFWQLIPFLKL